MRWTRLPETPNAPGFGGAFVGTSGDLLLCGGGSNFPDKPAWDGGVKVWHDEVFSLASTRSKKWASLGKLPRPCGYGVSVSIRQGLLMIGGADSHRHYADCYTLSVEEGELKVRPFPFLPRPLAYATGAPSPCPVFENEILVLGGDDGKLAGKVEASKHPGYAKSVLSYDKSTDTWTEAEEGSANVLSTACTKWSGGYALTNGELRPFVRSAEGWLLRTE